MSKLSLRAGLLAALIFSCVGLSACSDPVECEADGDCENGFFCGEDNTCAQTLIIIDPNICQDDAECTTQGQFCFSGTCEEGCRRTADCGSDEACIANACVEVGSGCEDTSECTAGLSCISGSCLECESNSQCSGGQVCAENSCESCSSNDQCDAGKSCVEGSCTKVETQCRNVGEACVEGAATRAGFTCAKFEGDDVFTCYDACQQREICSPGYLGDPNRVTCKDRTDCGPDQRCASTLSGSRCQDLAMCQTDADCRAAPGLTCVAGQCAFACTTDSECNSGGVCDTGSCRVCANDGECANGSFCVEGSCLDPALLYFEGEACPLGELCDEDTSGQRACRRSECEGPIRGQVSCNAVAAASPEAYPNGANCAPRRAFESTRIPRGNDDVETQNFDEENFRSFEQEVFFCEAAGLRQEGDTCGKALAGSNRPYPSCAQGLTCVSDLGILDLEPQFSFWDKQFDLVIGGEKNVAGICKKPCRRDEQCGVGEACIAEDNGLANGVGFCGVRCEPFTLLEKDACPEGTACQALSSNDGWCAELTITVEQGGTPQDIPFVQPASDGFAYGPCGEEGECPHGTRCLNLGTPRCLPQCDPTRPNQEVANDTCAGGDPNSYLKLLHLAQGAPAIDIYVDGQRVADDLAFEAAAGNGDSWISVKPGEHSIDVVLGTSQSARNPLLSLDIISVANEANVVTVLPDPNSISGIVAREFEDTRVAPVAADTEASLRLAHALLGAGRVDIIAVADGGDVNVPGDQIVLTERLSEGAVTNYLAVPAGTYDIYIFAQGDARTDLTAIAVLQSLSVTAGFKGTAFAFGSVGANARAAGVFLLEHQSFLYIPNTEGYCYDLNQGTSNPTTPSSGVCFQLCDQAIDFIDSPCEFPSIDSCQTFADDQGVCFVRTGTPTQTDCNSTFGCTGNQGCNEQGKCVDFCEPGEECCLSDDQCGVGYFCDARGADAAGAQAPGVCRSFCSTTGDAAFNACEGDEVCQPVEDIQGLGECRLGCTPDAPGSFTDSSCPAFQQTCLTVDGNRFCQPSGEGSIGDVCQGTSGRQCGPGALCARDMKLPLQGLDRLTQAFTTATGYEERVCTQLCRPFLAAGQNDCAEGFACSPVLPTQDLQTVAGICQPMVSKVGTDDDLDGCPGDEIGKMCGNAAYCSTGNITEKPEEGICEATGSCLFLCDPATNIGCGPGKECRTNGSVDFPSFILGAYGICVDS